MSNARTYYALRTIAAIHIVVGGILVGIGCLALYAVFSGSDASISGVGVLAGFVGIMVAVAFGLVGLGMLGFGQLIHLFIDIESNTRPLFTNQVQAQPVQIGPLGASQPIKF
jgi:hypothetical protein